MSKRTKIAIGVLGAILVLGIIGSLGSKDAGNQTQENATSSASPQTSPSASVSECPTAGDAFLTGLRSGFKKDWKDASITRSAYVNTGKTWTSSGETIYAVAVEVNGDIAVFGTDTDPTRSESGLIIAANDTARSISVWGSDAAPGSPILEAFANAADVASAEACLS